MTMGLRLGGHTAGDLSSANLRETARPHASGPQCESEGKG
jgi:hypothetical protein